MSGDDDLELALAGARVRYASRVIAAHVYEWTEALKVARVEAHARVRTEHPEHAAGSLVIADRYNETTVVVRMTGSQLERLARLLGTLDR